jgi:hypothetical protein
VELLANELTWRASARLDALLRAAAEEEVAFAGSRSQ